MMKEGVCGVVFVLLFDEISFQKRLAVDVKIFKREKNHQQQQYKLQQQHTHTHT